MKRVRLPPTTAEQRSEIYEDLRSLLLLGFLCADIRVQGIPFTLRTLNPTEFRVLKHRVCGRQGEWRPWTLAMSTWMMDGQILTRTDQPALVETYRCMRALPTGVQNTLYSVLGSLVRRSKKALETMEGYLYEAESRELWRTDGENLIAVAHENTGSKGLNLAQRYWMLYNRMEDDREKRNTMWAFVKFMTGAHAPKGIKKLNEKDSRYERDLELRRQSIRDRVYYESLGVIKRLEGRERDLESRPIKKAETEEELREEMAKWVAGEEDEHDVIVRSIKERIRESVEERKRLEEERKEELRQAFLEETKMDTGSFVFLSPEEAQKAQVPSASSVPHVYFDTGHNSFFEKHVARKPQTGALRVENGQIISGREVDPSSVETLLGPEEDASESLKPLREGQYRDPTSMLQSQIEHHRPRSTSTSAPPSLETPSAPEE